MNTYPYSAYTSSTGEVLAPKISNSATEYRNYFGSGQNDFTPIYVQHLNRDTLYFDETTGKLGRPTN